MALRAIVRAVPKPDPLQVLRDAGVPRQVIEDWLTIRKSKRAPLTITALKAVQREADKASMSLAAAVTMAVEHSWVGFKAEWALRDSATADTQRSRAATARVNEMTGGLAGRKPTVLKELK